MARELCRPWLGRGLAGRDAELRGCARAHHHGTPALRGRHDLFERVLPRRLDGEFGRDPPEGPPGGRDRGLGLLGADRTGRPGAYEPGPDATTGQGIDAWR